MKLRTSYFNPTAFRKDITRFAPAWALYTIFLLLTVLLMRTGSTMYFADRLGYLIMPFAVLNLLYALLNAQLLFGDLYSTRMCNALHAMPLRREGWFLTHLAAGVCFSLVPNAVICLILMPMLGKLLFIAPLVLLAAELQYLFFFGLAVLSALCVGNRFAMALVYGILNFLSLLVFWFLNTLYAPLLYGVTLDSEIFLLFCPVVHAAGQDYLRIDTYRQSDGAGGQWVTEFNGLIGESWGYLCILAVLGVVLLAAALLLYRRRKLECAGDFIAVRPLEPVFLVIYSIAVGAVLQMFYSLFAGSDFLLFLIVGVIIGFFTGRMLLKRTVKVFQIKAFLGLAVLLVILGASLGVTKLDPMGIARWVPDPESVASVTINPPYGDYDVGYYDGWNVSICTADPEQIAQVTAFHRQILKDYEAGTDEIDGPGISVTIAYRLDGGGSGKRVYTVPVSSPAGRMLKALFSLPETIFGTADKVAFLSSVQNGNFDGQEIPAAEMPGLVDALWQDCLEGNLTPGWAFHIEDEYLSYISFDLNGAPSYREIIIFSSAGNTVNWLKDHGYYFLEDMEKYGLDS